MRWLAAQIDAAWGDDETCTPGEVRDWIIDVADALEE